MFIEHYMSIGVCTLPMIPYASWPMLYKYLGFYIGWDVFFVYLSSWELLYHLYIHTA